MGIKWSKDRLWHSNYIKLENWTSCVTACFPFALNWRAQLRTCQSMPHSCRSPTKPKNSNRHNRLSVNIILYTQLIAIPFQYYLNVCLSVIGIVKKINNSDHNSNNNGDAVHALLTTLYVSFCLSFVMLCVYRLLRCVFGINIFIYCVNVRLSSAFVGR